MLFDTLGYLFGFWRKGQSEPTVLEIIPASAVAFNLAGDVVGPSNANLANDFQGVGMRTLEGTLAATDAASTPSPSRPGKALLSSRNCV